MKLSDIKQSELCDIRTDIDEIIETPIIFSDSQECNDITESDRDTDTDTDQLILKKVKIHKNTMYLNNDKTKPITAAGALFYKRIEKKIYLLISQSDGKYEDIGGKIEPKDKNIYETICREIKEETNSKILITSDRLKISQYVYVPHSKYIIYIIEANDTEKNLNRDDFGKRELKNNIVRTMGWISRIDLDKSSVINFKINHRMKYKNLFIKLLNIENNPVINFKTKLFK